MAVKVSQVSLSVLISPDNSLTGLEVSNVFVEVLADAPPPGKLHLHGAMLSHPVFNDPDLVLETGDRSVFDVHLEADKHASDISENTPMVHAPWPASAGEAPVSDGNKYVPTAIASASDLSTHEGLDNPHQTDFLDLVDSPSTYTGQAGKVVAVKSTEDGVEFITAGGGTPYDLDPEPDGTASPGTVDEYSRGDHVHPAGAGSGDMTKSVYDTNDDAKIDIAAGGTGAGTAQDAINALTGVAGATNEHVLTKDTASGNAVFKPAPSGSGSPGGNDKEIQFKNSTVFGGAANAHIESGYLALPNASVPDAVSGKSLIFSKTVAKPMLAFRGRGQDVMLQASLGHKRFAFVNPIGMDSTTIHTSGLNTSLAGGSARTFSTGGNLFLAQRRVGIQTSTSAAANASLMASSNFLPFTHGFTIQFRFGISGIIVGRAFVGPYIFNVAIGGNNNPSVFQNVVGMMFDEGETTWRIGHNDNVGTCTKIDLGANFPCDTNSIGRDFYDFMLHVPGSNYGDSNIYYHVVNLYNGSIASGTISTDLPTGNHRFHMWCNNGSSGASNAALDAMLVYIETDV